MAVADSYFDFLSPTVSINEGTNQEYFLSPKEIDQHKRNSPSRVFISVS